MPLTPQFISVLTSTTAQKFWSEHAFMAADKLLNTATKIFGSDAGLVLQQHALRLKAGQKFPVMAEMGWLFTPQSFEQASSAATARFKASLMQGEILVDLTAGAGIDAFFLREKFKKTMLIEANPERAALLRWNFREYPSVEVIEGDARECIATLPAGAVVFADPDRRPDGNRVSGLPDSTPDILALLPALRQKNSTLWLKAAPMLDIRQAFLQLGSQADCWTIAVGAEMKELLFKAEPGSTNPPVLHSVRLDAEGHVIHQWQAAFDGKRALPELSVPTAGMYLIEPHLALIKSRQARSYAANQGWQAINAQADYYLSSHRGDPAAGRWFELLHCWPYKPKVLLKTLQNLNIRQANVAKREFFMEVAAIRKTLKLSDGGDTYLFFTKNNNGEPLVLHGRRC